METFTKDAGDYFRLAVMFGGFDAGKVVKEVTRLQRGRGSKASMRTLERALANLLQQRKKEAAL